MHNIYEFLKDKHSLNINSHLLHKHFNWKKYFFIVDVESDGLWGSGFCVSAIVVDIKKGEIVDTFLKKININYIKNEWVKREVLPHLENVPICESLHQLQEEFWEFWIKYRQRSVTLTDSGSPVESFWFRECVANDLVNREMLAPFPQHDVATAVLVSGIGSVNRLEYALLTDYPRHHPYYDCLASLVTFVKAIYIIVFNIQLKERNKAT